MGIRFTCPNGHKLHVKAFLAGKRAVCPKCGAKTVIPSAQEPELTGAGAAANAVSVSQLGGIPPTVEPASDAGSPSIIISVADMPSATAPLTETDPSGMPSEELLLIPIDAKAPVESTFVPTLPDPRAPVSPAARYIANRERNRRHQFAVAVILLVAVIVLAVVLIFVLQRGGGNAVAGRITPSSRADFGMRPYVAKLFEHDMNPHTHRPTAL
jgi:hypothetical protein